MLKNVNPAALKPEANFYLDITFGILKSSSLVLNDIAYALNEKTSLKKVNERLYKNLQKPIKLSTKISAIEAALS